MRASGSHTRAYCRSHRRSLQPATSRSACATQLGMCRSRCRSRAQYICRLSYDKKVLANVTRQVGAGAAKPPQPPIIEEAWRGLRPLQASSTVKLIAAKHNRVEISELIN